MVGGEYEAVGMKGTWHIMRMEMAMGKGLSEEGNRLRLFSIMGPRG